VPVFVDEIERLAAEIEKIDKELGMTKDG